MLNTNAIRSNYTHLQQRVEISAENAREKPRIFLDSTASTQIPIPVYEQLLRSGFNYANVHRGEYDASQITTESFERAYNVAANLVNANSWQEIVFGRNTTEMINLVWRSMEYDFKDGDNVVVTGLEHNSNYVSWFGLQQNLAKIGKKIDLRIVPFDHNSGELDMNTLRSFVDRRTKVVAVSGASNFMGVRPDTTTIGEIAHASGYAQPDSSRGSYFLVDGAQLVPGSPVDVQKIGCDFLVWSFHKMSLPFGVGGLYARKEIIENLSPFLFGGDMIEDVKPGVVKLKPLPWRYTAGTPNILGTIVTGHGVPFLINAGLDRLKHSPLEDMIEHEGKLIETAILMNTPRGGFTIPYTVEDERQDTFRTYLDHHPELKTILRDPQARLERTRTTVKEAMGNIQRHEEELTGLALEGLSSIPNLTIYGPRNPHKRTGLVAFNIDGVSAQSVAMELNRRGIEVRNGAHCASLAHYYMNVPDRASVRMSFYVYTTPDEVQSAVAAVRDIRDEFKKI